MTTSTRRKTAPIERPDVIFACVKCGAEHPRTLEFFHKDRGRNDGMKTQCKSCGTAAAKGYFRDKRAGMTEAERHRYNLGRKLRHLYGLTLEEYDAMAAATPNCPLCGVALDYTLGVKGRMENGAVIDHCHETGKVRGIICGACNVGIGHFKDNADALRRAAEYIERHQR